MIFPVNFLRRFLGAGALCMVLALVCAPAQADVGGVGAKPVSIKKMAQDKRIRDQVNAILKRKEEAKQKAEAEKAAAEKKAAEEAAAQAEANKAAGLKEDAVPPAGMVDRSAPVAPAASGTGTATDTANLVTAPPPTPVLVIQFNKNHMNYEREIRHLLEGSERSKKAFNYTIVSEIPNQTPGGRRNARQVSTYENNLNDVVQKFGTLGVQASRITVSMKPTDRVTAQTVSVYQD